jgi:hypothetical protein
LETLADQDADADARQIVYDRLVELSDDPSIAEVLNQLNIDTDTPAEIEDPADQLSEDDNSSPVESAIIRRIMNNHLDLLKQYGPAAVMAAARDVADDIGDVEEIGSSDVSAYINRVGQSLDSGEFAHLEEQVNEQQLDEILPALGAAVGRAVVAKAIGSMLDNDDEEMDEGIPGNLPPSQISGKDKLLKTPATKPQGAADKLKDVLGGIKDFVSGKPEDPSRPTYEADNLSTFEGKCAMTAEGEDCPMHGLKECGMEEDLDTDGVMMTRQSNMSSESVDPMLSRMKSLAGILIR